MLSIILCSHAGLAEGLKSCAEMICGDLEKLVSITFCEKDSPEELVKRIGKEYDSFAEEGDEVVALVDLFGATPFDCCAQALSDTDTMIVTGMSLPLLLEILMGRENPGNYKEYISECVKNAEGSQKAVDLSEI